MLCAIRRTCRFGDACALSRQAIRDFPEGFLNGFFIPGDFNPFPYLRPVQVGA